MNFTKNTQALTASAYASMFFLGVSGAFIGAAARNIGLSPFEIGLMIAVQNVGFIISVSISGALADTRAKPKIMLVGSLILAFSLLAFYVAEIFWVNLVIMLLIGAGIGVYEGVTDAMLMDLHAKRISLHINVNHFFVTLGAIVISIYLTYLQMNWRISVIQSGVAVLLLALFFALARMQVKEKPSEPYLDRLKILARERIVIVFFMVTAIIVGVEAGTIGILTTFLMDLREFTQVTSKIGLTVFLIGVASGRLFVGIFSHREQIIKYLLALFSLSLVFFSVLYFVDMGNWSYLLIYLAGVAISALLPLVITLAGLLYPQIAGTVLGTIKIAIPIGGILTPFLMSVLARATSFQISLIVYPASFLMGLLLLLSVARSVTARLSGLPTELAELGTGDVESD
jgi:MFS family permease